MRTASIARACTSVFAPQYKRCFSPSASPSACSKLPKQLGQTSASACDRPGRTLVPPNASSRSSSTASRPSSRFKLAGNVGPRAFELELARPPPLAPLPPRRAPRPSRPPRAILTPRDARFNSSTVSCASSRVRSYCKCLRFSCCCVQPRETTTLLSGCRAD